ncbi:tumor protein p53-inducible protein 11-like isoform X5 [Saccostrea cucullata]|uniref:tumor protein p53-inducible protein 11-like isoform X5 n=1 Tax=Saccostrea cuccullata TaxID=36930 RepID=UPI002ED13108
MTTEHLQTRGPEVRKHSSGDLHSRLKTRKLLGVGETDDGDVHRSKLSQILGHSDQLYIRLPPGLRIWQIAMAIIMTVMASWAFIFPRHLFTTMYDGEYENTLPIRLYGVALLCLSLLYWYTVNTVDKDMIRLLLLCSILFFSLHTIVSALCLPFVTTLCAFPLLFLCLRLVCICVSVYFYWVFTRDWKLSSKEHWRLYKQQVVYHTWYKQQVVLSYMVQTTGSSIIHGTNNRYKQQVVVSYMVQTTGSIITHGTNNR